MDILYIIINLPILYRTWVSCSYTEAIVWVKNTNRSSQKYSYKSVPKRVPTWRWLSMEHPCVQIQGLCAHKRSQWVVFPFQKCTFAFLDCQRKTNRTGHTRSVAVYRECRKLPPIRTSRVSGQNSRWRSRYQAMFQRRWWRTMCFFLRKQPICQRGRSPQVDALRSLGPSRISQYKGSVARWLLLAPTTSKMRSLTRISTARSSYWSWNISSSIRTIKRLKIWQFWELENL